MSKKTKAQLIVECDKAYQRVKNIREECDRAYQRINDLEASSIRQLDIIDGYRKELAESKTNIYNRCRTITALQAKTRSLSRKLRSLAAKEIRYRNQGIRLQAAVFAMTNVNIVITPEEAEAILIAEEDCDG